MKKQRLTKEDLRTIAFDYVASSARENAGQTIVENHTRTEINEYGGYIDGHPEYHNYYLASLEGPLGSLGSEREYRDYVPGYIKRPLTEKEIKAVEKLILG